MKRIICIGDSNTFGYDPRSFCGSRYPEGVRWTSPVKTQERQVLNLGQNGAEIPRGPHLGAMAELLRRTASDGTADIVTVMLGSNDLLMGASAECAADRMNAFLKTIAGCLPGCGIIAIAPPSTCLGTWVQDERLIRRSTELSALYREAAEESGAGFADAGEWGVDISFDGVHFTPEGHASFARGLETVLEERGV